MYALVVAVALASLLALESAIRHGGPIRWIAYVISTMAGFTSHILLTLLLPVQVLFFLLNWSRSRQRWKGALAAVVCFALPFLLLQRWLWKLWHSPTFDPGFPYVPLPAMFTQLLYGFTLGVLGQPGVWGLTPWLFLLLAGVTLSVWEHNSEEAVERTARWGKQGWRLRSQLLIWLLLPPLLLWIVALIRFPVFTDRYLIWTGPAFYALIALGLLTVVVRSRVVFLISLVTVLGLNSYAIWTQSHHILKSDFRSAAAYVAERRVSDDLTLFLMPYIRHVYAYYAGWDYAWREAPYTNGGVPQDEIDQQMQELTSGHHVIWLIESEAEVADRRGLVRTWLEAHGQVSDDVQFARVRVTRYVLSNNPQSVDVQRNVCGLQGPIYGEEYAS